jgi:hypothetical protein
MEAPDKKSWTVPNSPNRLGFNDTGVFLHQDAYHMRLPSYDWLMLVDVGFPVDLSV